MVVGCLRKRAKGTKMELRELEAWMEVQVNKLDLRKNFLKELEAQTEVLKKVLKEKRGMSPC